MYGWRCTLRNSGSAAQLSWRGGPSLDDPSWLLAVAHNSDKLFLASSHALESTIYTQLLLFRRQLGENTNNNSGHEKQYIQ